MDVNLKVSALDKLLDYAASGIGSVAGPILANWRARQEAQAKLTAAEGDASVLQVRANAQAKARKALLPHNTKVTGELVIADVISQRIQFQEEKRQANIESVVRHAAEQLGDKSVVDSEPDHDWTARFFSEVQDVSSEEMQLLWARVLAGQVERGGSTSVRTLQVLRNLDQATARLFRTFCSMCVFIPVLDEEEVFVDGRVPALGGDAAHNALQKYDLDFDSLNRLNEHDLIISDYNSWNKGYQASIGILSNSRILRVPFRFQNRNWVLIPLEGRSQKDELKLSGVSLNVSGRELARVVDLEAAEQFTEDLRVFFRGENLSMTEAVPDSVDSYMRRS